MREYDHHLFYSDSITNNDTITLDDGEARHAVSVLRLKAGERLRITDGRGTIYDCQCVNIDKRSLSCNILDKKTIPRLSPELTLLVGLPDKEHFETILEHTTALGVARIVPVIMDHCRKPWWGAWEKSRERSTSKMVVSMKQCLYPYLPQLDDPVSLDKIVVKCDRPLVVADQRGTDMRDLDIPPHKKLSCLVGPPGGISPKEEELLRSQDPLIVRIAPTRLRTELAATVICSSIISHFGKIC